jgi:hypothetical protein
MSEYRSRVKLTIDLAKLKKSGMEPRRIQEGIYHFFIEKGFTCQRQLGFVYDRELTKEEWGKIVAELNDHGWLELFHHFHTDVIGETSDLTYLFWEEEKE